jgi:hypothetical protein
MGKLRNAYVILVRTPEGKRPFRMCRRIHENNIKMDLRDVECESVDWIYLAYNSDQWRALVNTVMNLQDP